MMAEMQKQFEEWAHDGSKGYKLKLWHLINQDGTKVYTNELTNDMWKAWQASRAAVVVKLPDWFVSGIDAAMYRDDVIKALDEAGVDYED
jgi:hypothetical protein